RDWPGLLAPVVGLGGLLVGARLGDLLGRTGPDPVLDWEFLSSNASTIPADSGLFPAIVGSVFIISIVAIVSFVVGVGAAIYLEEYAPQTGAAGTVTRIVRVNIANLAGVPSVVYGLLGLGLFVNLIGMGMGIVLVAGLTLSLLILPIVIISAQEAIRSVPVEVREASYGMGATRWQTIRNVVLPRAVPGILTGTILALSRAIGETAPLLMIGAATTVFRPPTGFASQVSAMPLQVFYWSFSNKSAFRELIAPAGVVTLLVVMLSMNVLAIYLRNRFERQA
ncbi:MAG: phosphate ABC transporter permease PstA, partial [Halodesulfurarchaeum sp.]